MSSSVSGSVAVRKVANSGLLAVGASSPSVLGDILTKVQVIATCFPVVAVVVVVVEVVVV